MTFGVSNRKELYIKSRRSWGEAAAHPSADLISFNTLNILFPLTILSSNVTIDLPLLRKLW